MDDVEESVVAKSTGQQEEKDIVLKDAALYNVLSSKKKMTKDESGYKEQEKSEEQETNNYNNQACIKCKFNLPDEKKCHIVEGEINNEYGISNFFSSKGDGMLPGDIVWDFIKKTGRKLEYEEGHVIGKGAEGYQCKDCKYYMYSDRCLLIKGNTFMPEMSCAFVVKIGNGTDL
jgi:RNA polymerase subunit RPABC4/transcription elongation factor Spt4